MLAFPVHPRYCADAARRKREWDCVRPVALLAALTQTRNLFTRSEGRKMDEERDDLLGAGTRVRFLLLLMRAFRYAQNGNFDPGPMPTPWASTRSARGRRANSSSNSSSIDERHDKNGSSERLGGPWPRPVPRTSAVACSSGSPTNWRRRLDEGTLRCQLVGNRRGVLARRKRGAASAADRRRRGARNPEGRRGRSGDAAESRHGRRGGLARRNYSPMISARDSTCSSTTTARRVMVRRQRRFRDLALAETLSDDPPK